MKATLVVTVLLARLSGALAQPTCAPTWSEQYWNLEPRGEVRVIKTLDDGSGPCLYVGVANYNSEYNFISWLTRFDGTDLDLLGPFEGDVGQTGGGIMALEMFDDGGGPVMFVGGAFQTVAGIDVAGITRRRAGAWEPVGSGVNGTIRDLCPFDDGSGMKLYVCGLFSEAGNAPAACIARWDGSQWSAVGSGFSGGIAVPPNTAPACLSLDVHDQGSGPVLVAGGVFDHAGGLPALNVAQWDGATWSQIGSGLSSGPAPSSVIVVETVDLGSGLELIGGGVFVESGSQALTNIARWDGAAWQPVGAGINGRVSTVQEFDDGAGRRLFAGTLGGRAYQYTGGFWEPAGVFSGNGLLRAMSVTNVGGAHSLAVGGRFTYADDTRCQNLAFRAGGDWQRPPFAARRMSRAS